MPARQDLVHVSYCSQPQSPVEPDELSRILQASQRNHQRDQITGLLAKLDPDLHRTT